MLPKKINMIFRVQYTAQRDWVFICKKCLMEIKPNNIYYSYGGTWKGLLLTLKIRAYNRQTFFSPVKVGSVTFRIKGIKLFIITNKLT